MAKIVYHNSDAGDDGDDGLTALTPKKTLPAAAALVTDIGDELLSTNGAGGAESLAASLTIGIANGRNLHRGMDATFTNEAFYHVNLAANALTYGGFGCAGHKLYIYKTLGNGVNLGVGSRLSMSVIDGGGNQVAGNTGIVYRCTLKNGVTGLYFLGTGIACAVLGQSANGALMANNNLQTVLGCLIASCGIGVISNNTTGRALSVIGNIIYDCVTAVSLANQVATIEHNRIENCDNGITSAQDTGPYFINNNVFHNITNSPVIDMPKYYGEGNIVSAASGLINPAGGDYGTLPTAEGVSVPVPIGAGDSDYGTAYIDAGLQALISGGGGGRLIGPSALIG